MKQITSQEFRDKTKLDPAWASKLTEPVEVTGFCDMACSKISHLSPLLHFTGEDMRGITASFHNCKELKVVEGHFTGYVNFSNTNIEKIGDLTCGKNKIGNSALFYRCKALKLAEGNYAGFVNFLRSGIEKIGNITCGPNSSGIRLGVSVCKQLKEVPIEFNPKEIEADIVILEKLKTSRRREAAKKHLQSEIIEI